MERRCVYCMCRGLGHSRFKMRLLTSFQSQKEQEYDQSWSCLRTAFQILIRVESIVTCH